ncbi:MAG: phosphocholine cytidylyltransferase family protein [Eubacterium sp.]|jgi:choline kinase|nr:phosphocholine cytidylyltransferase family protein [Eubacterium sp.]
MKVIILAAGQGTRLKPLTDDRPKCMVEVKGRSIIDRQLDTMHACGIADEDITMVAGYRSDALIEKYKDTAISIITNEKFETTNMVCSLMCAKELMGRQEDVLISYGDIIYEVSVLQKVLESKEDSSVVVDDGWYGYWAKRCDNPLDDAETLMYDNMDYLTEIGQKTTDLNKVQSQYIGLMRFRGTGLKAMLALAKEAEARSSRGQALWRTSRTYQNMYMTDLLQGLIDEGSKLKAVHINRGWFEVDNREDLGVVESQIS